jgi:hypothetical protein
LPCLLIFNQPIPVEDVAWGIGPLRKANDKNCRGLEAQRSKHHKRGLPDPFSPGWYHHLRIVDYSAGAMGSTTDEKRQQVSSAPFVVDDAVGELGELVNSSGHVQELDRNFGFWSICSIGIVADDAWAAGAGSLVRSPRHAPPWGAFLDHANFNFSGKVVAFYDGGAPGILYEL